MNYKNVKIKFSKGVFYESSKEKLEGFNVEVETKEHGTRYHKEYKNLKGKLTKIAHDEEGMFGERLKVFIEEDDDNVIVLEMNVFRQKNVMDDYTKGFLQIADNLELGENVEFFLNSKKKDKKGYLYKNIFATQKGEKVRWAFEFKDIPAWEEVPDPIKKGKMTWDSTKQTAFFYDKLVQLTSDESVPEQSSQEPKAEEPKEDVEDDNLPF